MIKFSTKKLIWLIAVIGLLIFLHFTKILFPLELLTVKIITPLMKNSYSLSSTLKNTYNEQFNRKDLNKEIEKLEDQVNELIAENIRLKLLEEENNILRDHLQFLTKGQYSYIISNIISQGDFNQVSELNSVIIDKGSKDNVYIGLPVISSKGIIIGKIINTKEYISEVYLINNPKCKLAAAIQNKDKTSGIAQGELGLTAKMDFIPQIEEVNIGDIIITSGLEQNIPRGLIIGRVSQVFKESNEIWQKVTIEPMIDIDELVIVSVLLP